MTNDDYKPGVWEEVSAISREDWERLKARKAPSHPVVVESGPGIKWGAWLEMMRRRTP